MSRRVAFGVFFSVLLLALARRNTSPTQNVLPFAILAALHAYMLTTRTDRTGEPMVDYHIGVGVTFLLLNASDYLFVTHAQRDLHRLDQKTPIPALPYLGRLRWALDLVLNPRGVNWTFGTARLEYSQQRRWEFVRAQLRRAVGCFVVYDIASLADRARTVYLAGRELDGAEWFFWRTVGVLIFWASSRTAISITHTLLSVIAVVLGISQPRDWPKLFGPWWKLDSVGAIWGQNWHQLLRRPLVAHGKYAARILGFAPHSAGAYLTQVLVAFVLSGFIHASGDWCSGHDATTVRANIVFFLSQAGAVIFETAVVLGARRRGVRGGSWARVVGVMWVAAWMAWSCPEWMAALWERMGSHPPPVSVVGLLLKWVLGVGGVGVEF
ncbi:membrane bound O-acyl transferase family-domain-containing protein [Infundibulicybe gibba]|nr:membrane bound O-acyl transferase family-domain-containing protein [Infundibulicybe gibba]